MEAIDGSTDQLVWMFKQQGLHATAELSEEHLADEVIRWGVNKRMG